LQIYQRHDGNYLTHSQFRARDTNFRIYVGDEPGAPDTAKDRLCRDTFTLQAVKAFVDYKCSGGYHFGRFVKLVRTRHVVNLCEIKVYYLSPDWLTEDSLTETPVF
jgi:hypothetical protein